MVKDVIYRYYIKIFDTSGVPKTDLVNADFSKSIIVNGVIGSNTITVTHVASGIYKVEVTPTTVGDYLIDIVATSVSVPRYFTREEYCYETGIDDITIETNATANKVEVIAEIDENQTLIEADTKREVQEG